MTPKQLIARQNKVKKLIADRYTYKQIGEMFGISPQRVWQLAHHHYFDPAGKNKKKPELGADDPLERAMADDIWFRKNEKKLTKTPSKKK
jgi:hypothetical protein